MEKSYNGWTASKTAKDFGGLDNRLVPGTKNVRLIPGVRPGAVATVLFYVAAQLHARVESGDMYAGGDEWGYSYRLNRNANNLSCHSSGTAFDWNATRHPNGKRGTFTKAQVAEIRRILAEVDKVVRWGGDFTGTPDEMHFEIVASPATVQMVADRLTRKTVTPTPTFPTYPGTPSPVQEDDMADPDVIAELRFGNAQAEGTNKKLDQLGDVLREIGSKLGLSNTKLDQLGDLMRADTAAIAALKPPTP